MISHIYNFFNFVRYVGEILTFMMCCLVLMTVLYRGPINNDHVKICTYDATIKSVQYDDDGIIITTSPSCPDTCKYLRLNRSHNNYAILYHILKTSTTHKFETKCSDPEWSVITDIQHITKNEVVDGIELIMSLEYESEYANWFELFLKNELKDKRLIVKNNDIKIIRHALYHITYEKFSRTNHYLVTDIYIINY